MSDTVIRVENLGKKYIIGHQKQERYLTLRDAIAQTARSVGQRFLPSRYQKRFQSQEEFWALKDVSFEIKQGDRVGIIGRNGAGKSTLLKVLSRITEPTTGRISIKGRVASLLEVGTGFHPELTGRENIFLNGAILGMSKTEISRKFDEIVDFSEIEKFLDTPVKRYSSGMYVRLAFAVAAHLEPEILVVDEVLAVGDSNFQKKCLGKMGEIGGEGRTVLFVSHQMAAVKNLCQSGIYLNQGQVIAVDIIDSVIKEYINFKPQESCPSLLERKDRQGTGDILFTSVSFQDNEGNTVTSFSTGQNIEIVISFKNRTNKNLRKVHVSLGIDDHLGQRITYFSNDMTNEVFDEVSLEANQFNVFIPKLPLLPGRYSFTLHCRVNEVVADWIKNAGFFDVESGDYYGTGKLPPVSQGNFLIEHHMSFA